MRVRVLGGGVVGLVIAETLTGRGHAVHVVDPAPGPAAYAGHPLPVLALGGVTPPRAWRPHSERAPTAWRSWAR
ncbi:NAD-binding protein [Nocardioides sp. TRM66260-LWL]|uniref:NAD-binding protein n=1 Tax=Nocardioides sp. TRM66260-LWL TaxID=2874478 RepID=UPI001CC5818C|nr:NAD-binding protein [Nocardioides sp. TRM66260-LWL]MBZ5733453.1 NAD-binding protein [Nocardioides sp. TRM66260-LWL]